MINNNTVYNIIIFISNQTVNAMIEFVICCISLENFEERRIIFSPSSSSNSFNLDKDWLNRAEKCIRVNTLIFFFFFFIRIAWRGQSDSMHFSFQNAITLLYRWKKKEKNRKRERVKENFLKRAISLCAFDNFPMWFPECLITFRGCASKHEVRRVLQRPDKGTRFNCRIDDGAKLSRSLTSHAI